MKWPAIVQALAALIAALNTLARRHADRALQREGKRMGRLEAVHEALRDATQLLEQAELARAVFRSQLRTDPDSLRTDDGYRRHTSGSARDAP